MRDVCTCKLGGGRATGQEMRYVCARKLDGGPRPMA